MTNQVSETSLRIMGCLLAGPVAAKDVAEKLNVKTVVVTGSLAGLKKAGYVEMALGKMNLTEEGAKIVRPAAPEKKAEEPAVGVTVVTTTIAKKGDKKAQAAAIVKRLGETAARKDVVAAFMAELSMSKAQASTYHYNLCGSQGIWRA